MRTKENLEAVMNVRLCTPFRIGHLFRSGFSVAFLSLFCAVFFFHGVSTADPLAGSYMEKQARMRNLEQEISALELELDLKKRVWSEIYQKISEVQSRIAESNARIEKLDAQLKKSWGKLSSKVRVLYVDGRLGDLVQILMSRDVTDFLANFENLILLTVDDARAFSHVRKKRQFLIQEKEALAREKKRLSSLLESVDRSKLESEIALKRQELASIWGELVESQPPVVVGVYPTYNPSRALEAPDETLFIGTGQIFSGYSSWYGNEFHGRTTANGEIFDQYGLTCAHRTLPFGTWLRVTFRGRSVIVRVNDRGPFISGRILDLSRGAAEALGLTGVQWVDCEIVVPRSS